MKATKFLRIFSFGLALSSVAVMTGCNKEPLYTPVSSHRAVIDDFWLEKTAGNAGLNRAYQGMIVGDTAIRLMVDYGTDITSLEPTVFADADSIAPKGKQNFSNPVKYTVWAKGQSATYTVRISVSPVQFPVIKKIAAGFSHIMALKTDGTVWVCGNNASAQLGLGDYSGRNTLTQVPIYDAEQIFTGDAASIIKLKDGTAWGTGNQFGQLGLGHINTVVSFTRIPFLDNAVQIAITFREVLALKPDGTVWGAGYNAGQLLLQGDNERRATFARLPLSNVTQLKGCAGDVMVQKANGEWWGWGDNVGGELGVGDKLPRRSPVLLPTPPAGVAKLFLGGNSCFVIDNNGKMWATGPNYRGQLAISGLGAMTAFTPVPFFDNRSIDEIVPHSSSTTFKEANGTVWNVGDNVVGQMGLGSISNLPNALPLSLTGFQASSIAGYGNTVFSLKTDGSLWAWGANSAGALGTGTDITNSASPIQIKTVF